MTDRVTVGDLVFYVVGQTLEQSAKTAVERYRQATGDWYDAYSVTVERDGRQWRFLVQSREVLTAKSIDVAEFRAAERAS